MTYLVDTHVAIWSLLEPRRLSSIHRRILAESPEVKFVSTVSLWELSVKYSLGKLKLKNTTPETMMSSFLEAGYHILPLDPDDAATGWHLPHIDDHHDPFDRLLVWQCIRNDLVFLSTDTAIEGYMEHGLRLAGVS